MKRGKRSQLGHCKNNNKKIKKKRGGGSKQQYLFILLLWFSNSFSLLSSSISLYLKPCRLSDGYSETLQARASSRSLFRLLELIFLNTKAD